MGIKVGLFDQLNDFNGDIHRNIVSLRESEDLFDDLTDGDPELSEVAIRAEMRVKQDCRADFVERGFFYSLAIGYPFETEPFMDTRFGDGTYGVWYGSLDLTSSIYETAYHTKRDILNIVGIEDEIVRERAVYTVHCEALLVDLRSKASDYPDLVGDDYVFCQQIGSRLHREGHPGCLTPSARCEGGKNAVILSSGVLRNPRQQCYLTYKFDPKSGSLEVERNPGEVLFTL